MHRQHNLILKIALQVDNIKSLQSMQNHTQPMIVNLFRDIRCMLLIFFEVVPYFGQAIIITTFSVHVLNTVNGAVVLVLRLVLELDAFHERTENVAAQSLDVENVARTDVSVIDFLFMQEVDAVHEVDEDL